MVIWDDSKIYLQHEVEKTFHSLSMSNCHSVFLLSLTVFQMYHPSLNPIFSLLYSWNFLLAFVLSVPLKCPMDKYQCLFWVLVLLDLYFTFLVYPATQEFSPLACGVLFDHFPQFLAFLYWSYFSSPQKITLVSWFYPVSFLYSLVLIYFDCLHLIFCISFQ